MKWFYQDNSSEVGPLSETALRELHQCGTFSSTTLIRREDSEDWGTFEDLLSPDDDTLASPTTTSEPELKKFYCIHCGQRISADSSQVGMMATCPSCSGEVLIPGEHVQPMAVVPVAPSRVESADAAAGRARGLWAKLDAPSLAFSLRSAAPIFICCLGFGWMATWILPQRVFSPDLTPSSLIGVLALATPAVAITLLGMIRFLGYPRRNWMPMVGALIFTMVVGIAILLIFYRIAESYEDIKVRSYGKATPFVLGVRLIGWAEQYRYSESFFPRLFASIIHTGFCEEVAKLLPMFLIVFLNRNQSKVPQLRGFLMIAFFSGLGFGIAEAVKVYSPWSGNTSITSNVIRWYACVPLHAVYTVIDAAFLWLLIPSFKKVTSWLGSSGILLAAALGVAIIHGIYNTCAEIHPLAGLILDAAAIALMVKLIRYCAVRETSSVGGAESIEACKMRLPKWLLDRDGGLPAFGRMYAAAGMLVLASLLFSSSVTGFGGYVQDSSSERTGQGIIIRSSHRDEKVNSFINAAADAFEAGYLSHMDKSPVKGTFRTFEENLLKNPVLRLNLTNRGGRNQGQIAYNMASQTLMANAQKRLMDSSRDFFDIDSVKSEGGDYGIHTNTPEIGTDFYLVTGAAAEFYKAGLYSHKYGLNAQEYYESLESVLISIISQWVHNY
jgi:RsiW-degrading membrane proteinase PrsW (M82 family)/DNA-directed RNA polymerase subunit RPC12/RpoP